MTTYVTLPRELIMDDDTVHVQHWRTRNFAVYQNYTTPIEHGGEFLGRANQVSGQSMFHVFRVIQHEPAGEELGEKLGSYTDVNAAMNWIAREEQLA